MGSQRTAGRALEVDGQSYWAPFTTHFPALGAYVEPDHTTACVLGGSDGKFVLPLLRAGMSVTAVDVDETFLFGGEVHGPEGEISITGLSARLAEEQLAARCEIVVCDYMEWEPERTFDVVVTSGSWSMPENHHHSLAVLLGAVQRMTAPGGLAFVDYLAEIPGEQEGEHYPPAQRVAAMVDADPAWQVLESRDLGLRRERHYDKPEWHEHRFAALIARRDRGLR